MPQSRSRRGSKSYRKTTCRARKATITETEATQRMALTAMLTRAMVQTADVTPEETIMQTKQDQSISRARFKMEDNRFPKSNSLTTMAIAETRMSSLTNQRKLPTVNSH